MPKITASTVIPVIDLYPTDKFALARPGEAIAHSITGFALIAKAGGVYNVKNYGATGDGTSDDSAAIQATINAAGTHGVVYFPYGTYYLGSAPVFLGRNYTGMLLSGYGATIKLSGIANRFLDFTKIADHDIFQNIAVEGFTVDANNVVANAHVIIGSRESGVPLRVRWQNIVVRDCRAYNISSDTTTTRYGIDFTTYHAAAGEGTQDYIKNILIDNVRLEGGMAGIVVGGFVLGGADGCNIVLDKVRITNCWHSTLAVPTSLHGSSNFHVGSYAKGGEIEIDHCYGYGSCDVGIEVNNCDDIRVNDCLIEEAYNAPYYFTNYNTPVSGKNQVVRWKNCTSRKLSTVASTNSFKVTSQTAIPIGHMYWEGCDHYSPLAPANGSGGEGWSITNGGGAGTTFSSAHILHCHFSNVGWTWNQAPQYYPAAIFVQPSTTEALIEIKDFTYDIEGTRSGGGNLYYAGLFLIGSAIVDIDGFYGTFDCVNAASVRIMELGQSTAVLRGNISRVVPTLHHNTVGTMIGIMIAGTGTLTINPQLLISQCDFSKMTAANEIFFADATNKPYIRLLLNKYITNPVAVSNVAVGGSPYTYQNLDSYTEIITISGGTVSAIEYSRDNANWYNAGVTSGSFYLYPDDYLRITHAGAPTATKFPER